MKKLTTIVLAMIITLFATAQFKLLGNKLISNDLSQYTPKTPVTTLFYCTDDVFDALGTIEPSNISLAIQLPASTMNTYTGNFINKISVGVKPSEFTSFTLKIWSDISSGAGTVAYEEIIDMSTLTDGWNEIPLSTPFPIDGSNIYVGYTVAATGYGCYLDYGPVEPNGYGDLVYSDVFTTSGWSNLHILEPSFNFNTQIKVHIDDGVATWFDLALSDFIVPPSNCDMTNNEEFTVTVTNTGTENITDDFNIAYSINDNFANQVLVPIQGPLNADETKDVTFNIDLSTDDTYMIKVYSKLNPDQVAFNDTVYAAIINSEPETYPYLENFDVENIAWNIEDVNSDNNTWEFLDEAQVNPTACMAYLYSKTNQADDYLFSTCLELNSNETYKIKFNYKGGYSQSAEQMKIFIGNAPNSSAMTTELFDIDEINNSQFQEFDSSFTVNSDGVYYIGFYAYGNPDNQKFIIFEDFFIDVYEEYDVGANAIVGLNSACDLGMTDITVSVQNFGSQNLTNVPVSYTINGGTPITETIPTIDFDATVEYTFTTQADFSNSGQTYTVAAYTELSGDTNSANDSTDDFEVVNVVSESAPYINNFDNSNNALLGWNIEDFNEDGSTWNFYDENGEQYMGYQYNSTNPAEDFLYSTCIELNTNTVYQLKFKYACLADNLPEKLKVFLGDAQSATAMTTEIVNLPSITNANFSQSTTNGITVPANGVYYLGFYAYSDPNMWRLKLDDVELNISSVSVNNLMSENINIYPNPANNILMIENAQDALLDIVNILGQIFISQNISTNKENIDISNLPEGTYIIRIKNGDKISTQKLNIIH